MNQSAPRGRSRKQLLLIFALFLGSVLLAAGLFFTGFKPMGTVNNGVLVTPQPVLESGLSAADGAPLDRSTFAGRWTMLLVSRDDCRQACLETLDQLKRVQIALNQDMDRVQLGLVLLNEAAAPEVPIKDLLLLRAGEAQLRDWRLPEAGTLDQTVHLVDPRAFRMMAYPAPLDARGLLKDLKRLLKLSSRDIEEFERGQKS